MFDLVQLCLVLVYFEGMFIVQSENQQTFTIPTKVPGTSVCLVLALHFFLF